MKSAFLHSAREVIQELHERGFYADCSALVTDSRRLAGAQDVFIAIPGSSFDPRLMADDLIEEGRCDLVLVEHEDKRSYRSAHVLPVRGLKSMLGELADLYYGQPSLKLKVIAVTGTNGKTTVTRWIAQCLNALGEKAAVIGTLGYGMPDSVKPHSGLTTPDCVGLHALLFELWQSGCGWVAIEASSIGLEQGRLSGVNVLAAVYTNLSRDHLDYHKTMEAYAQAKQLLLSQTGLQCVVVNADDEQASEFARKALDKGVRSLSVGQVDLADVQLDYRPLAGGGIQLSLGGRTLQAEVTGDFNASNLALAFVLLKNLLPNKVDELVAAVQTVTPPPGRMQLVHKDPLVVVDYAHTPDALEQVLRALSPTAKTREGRLIALFGCGGDRDPGKRPLMAELGARLADVVYFTSDNPRTEPVEQILDQMMAGVDAVNLPKVHRVADRVEAIRSCLSGAEFKDVVLLAGKGHETTQTIGTEIHPHSDVDCVKAFYQRGAA